MIHVEISFTKDAGKNTMTVNFLTNKNMHSYSSIANKFDNNIRSSSTHARAPSFTMTMTNTVHHIAKINQKIIAKKDDPMTQESK